MSFKKIIKETPDEEVQVIRSENEILTEVLSSIRMIDKRMRRLENEDNHSIILKDGYYRANEKQMSMEEAQQMTINNLINKNVPIELIEEFLSNSDIPESFIKNELAMRKNKMRRTK